MECLQQRATTRVAHCTDDVVKGCERTARWLQEIPHLLQRETTLALLRLELRDACGGGGEAQCEAEWYSVRTKKNAWW